LRYTMYINTAKCFYGLKSADKWMNWFGIGNTIIVSIILLKSKLLKEAQTL